MKPADALQERTDMIRNTMKRAITAVLAVIMERSASGCEKYFSREFCGKNEGP